MYPLTQNGTHQVPMHTYSMASGLAIARLVEDAPADLVQEAAAYVERARVNLALDNSALVAALMFAQPLIKMWVPHWCAARSQPPPIARSRVLSPRSQEVCLHHWPVDRRQVHHRR